MGSRAAPHCTPPLSRSGVGGRGGLGVGSNGQQLAVLGSSEVSSSGKWWVVVGSGR